MADDPRTGYEDTTTALPEKAKRRGALPRVFEPAGWEPEIAYALKALALGEASEEQQKAALRWIMFNASDYQSFTYRPDDMGGARDHAFAEGRKFVGQQIAKLVNMPGHVLARMRKDAENG